MNQKDINAQELSRFVSTHKLRNRYSNIHFNAIISITTAQNKITNRQMEVRISFDNYNSYGEVLILKEDLAPYTYPTKFEAKWQKMKHIDDEYLLINDIHKQNPTIGKYQVKIIPLEKILE